MLARPTLRLAVAPVGLVLAAAALAERQGAETAVFYLFLLGIVVSGAGGLASFAAVVDAVSAGVSPALARFHAALAALVVAVCVVGAVARSPVALGFGAPGLAPFALALGFLALALLAAVSLAGVRR